MLLHHCMKPSSRISLKNAKIWKFSIADSQSGQIMVVHTLNDLENQLEIRREKYKKNGMKMQPFVFIIKNEIELDFDSYVYVDTFYYKCENLLSAVDLCFKIFHIFNVQYGKDCEVVWEFIQKYFYNITTPFDENYSQILNFISSL